MLRVGLSKRDSLDLTHGSRPNDVMGLACVDGGRMCVVEREEGGRPC